MVDPALSSPTSYLAAPPRVKTDSKNEGVTVQTKPQFVNRRAGVGCASVRQSFAENQPPQPPTRKSRKMAGRKMAPTAWVGFIFLPAIFLLKRMKDWQSWLNL
jgi:hypothetical protein